jgi:hypothetical protein
MAINNTKAFIRSEENREAVGAGQGISAFDASIILAIAFCKSKEEVIMDLIKDNGHHDSPLGSS